MARKKSEDGQGQLLAVTCWRIKTHQGPGLRISAVDGNSSPQFLPAGENCPAASFKSCLGETKQPRHSCHDRLTEFEFGL
ncbi:hypothetical protein STEG23_021738 [Scotinomys teguina]